MTALDISTASAALKAYYSDQRVQMLMYKDAPLWAMLQKIKDFYGKNYPLPLCVSNPQGRSATFTNAQAQKTPSVFRDFTLTRSKDYALASITSEAIMASETNPGAFLRLATREIDGALMSLKRSIAFSCYGDGSGSLAAVSAVNSAATPSVLQLTNVEDIVKFEVGQLLQVKNTAGAAHVFATGITTATVAAVDRDAGTITTDVAGNAGSTVVATDLLYVVGDYNAKFTGLAGWIPGTAPAATAFFGLDRTLDPTRLAGVRVVSGGKPLDEAFIDAARRVGREGGTPGNAFMGFSRYASLEKTLGSRVIYDEVEIAGVGFRGMKISGPSKSITVMADRDCPENRAYLLDLDTWAYYSLKEPTMILDLDGNRILREASADAYEVRCATFGQLGCDFPGSNAVMTFA